MSWQQVYNPLNSIALSTLFAAIPIVVLLGTLAIFRVKAHWAAVWGLISALVVAVLIFGMPTEMALATAVYGAAFGICPSAGLFFTLFFCTGSRKTKVSFRYYKTASLASLRTTDCNSS